ncbi:hypothetical protein DICSQDRAFT_175360 [Dichomitus squalens LYAD-421 SS1]|uniref:Uncharacterized protein n=1 Tax=Dichomitus squalens (strain LYAD-421) TaxID=732165 RepID=R7SIJ3_DICSQ|nr:uncharacterized protein DICSQDRAFT_175360 [Dichomitus squalens LYAD-421 SS1]EJF55969.1 hypothetical protein DICSQDRAFT_175360 [Dichomitus squalens LYAD-421 SS1]
MGLTLLRDDEADFIDMMRHSSEVRKILATGERGAQRRAAKRIHIKYLEKFADPLPGETDEQFEARRSENKKAKRLIAEDADACKTRKEHAFSVSTRGAVGLPHTDLRPSSYISAYPRSGPWKPPLECTDDTKAPYDTDYEDSDAPVTPERPADTPLPSSNGPAVSDIYGPLIRSVIQLRAHVDALPPDARAKVVATVTKFHEETGTVADLMALLPSPSSGSGKDKHEESPSDTNTRNKRK